MGEPSKQIDAPADPRRRNRAIVDLHLADESYVEPILSKLCDPVAKVRRHAIHALSCGDCKPNRQPLAIRIETALLQVLESDLDPRVREEAREALERLGHPVPPDVQGSREG